MSVSPQSNRTASSTGGYATRALIRRILWALLALAPVTILIDYLTHADKVVLFLLSCAALVPLAWLIGESTEHAAEHTGPGIGGFPHTGLRNAAAPDLPPFRVAVGPPHPMRGSPPPRQGREHRLRAAVPLVIRTAATGRPPPLSP